MSTKNTVVLHIMDREFKIVCPTNKEQELRHAAHFLDTKLRETRQTGGAVGLERIAIITALQLAHELITRSSGGPDVVTSTRLQALQKQIDSALAETKESKNEAIYASMGIEEKVY